MFALFLIDLIVVSKLSPKHYGSTWQIYMGLNTHAVCRAYNIYIV